MPKYQKYTAPCNKKLLINKEQHRTMDTYFPPVGKKIETKETVSKNETQYSSISSSSSSLAINNNNDQQQRPDMIPSPSSLNLSSVSGPYKKKYCTQRKSGIIYFIKFKNHLNLFLRYFFRKTMSFRN